MRRGFVLAVLLIAIQAQAITWTFDTPGDAQGWIAREGIGLTNRATLRSEVVDGIWRIFPAPYEEGRYPNCELISPLIHRDSELFDRVIVRFRIVHSSPVNNYWSLFWTNARNRLFPARDPEPDRDLQYMRYGIIPPRVPDMRQWQEVVVGHLGKDAEYDWSKMGGLQKIVWEGELLDIRIGFFLASLPSGQRTIERPEEQAEAVEIDQIVLTGVEELLQGELPPPAVSSLPTGRLFEPPSFQALGARGVGASSPANNMAGVLGLLDGDQILDLVAIWKDDVYDFGIEASVVVQGWLETFGEGAGGLFVRPRSYVLARASMYVMDGADLDHDGRMELLLGSGISTQVMGRDDEQGWQVLQEFQGLWPLGLGDADGDGQVDLWMLDYASGEGEVAVFLNDGKGEFDPSQRLVLAPPRPGFSPFSLGVQGISEERRGLLWAPPWDHPGLGYEVTSWNEEGAVVQEHLATAVPVSLVRYAGDFDQDGDVDLLVSDELVRDANYTYRGLSFLLNQGDGILEQVAWDSEVEVPGMAQAVCFRDLNEDGCLDLVAVDSNLRQPAVVVGLGQDTGVPVLEGRYPLPEGYGGPVLAGDVDGDGDPDLVVLEPAGGGTGGVHVLLSRLSEQGTAVGEDESRLPAAFHLGPNYPNPFNPQTWIPVEIPASSEPAQLRIYNLLGQPIRTLVSGRLTPGYHAVPWDGRDERGAVVSSGVYLYRLEAGARGATGRMVKSR